MLSPVTLIILCTIFNNTTKINLKNCKTVVNIPTQTVDVSSSIIEKFSTTVPITKPEPTVTVGGNGDKRPDYTPTIVVGSGFAGLAVFGAVMAFSRRKRQPVENFSTIDDDISTAITEPLPVVMPSVSRVYSNLK